MPLKTHNRFNYQQIVVMIFILLNGLFTVAPFLHASVVNKETISTSGLPVQNQPCEEECNHLNNLTDAKQECQFTFRNKQNFSHRASQAKPYSGDSGIHDDQNFLRNSGNYLLIRPQYYSFLSIYYLF